MKIISRDNNKGDYTLKVTAKEMDVIHKVLSEYYKHFKLKEGGEITRVYRALLNAHMAYETNRGDNEND